MKRTAIVILSIALSAASMTTAMAASAPAVVVSIKPLHSLVANVMEGVGEPDLIIGSGASPHGYQMRPSQAAALGKADVIIWIGRDMESFLVRPLANLGKDAEIITLTEAPQISLLRFREGAVWPEDGGHDEQDEHGHDEQDEHGHDEQDEHGHDEQDEHGHDEQDEHGHDEQDEHGHDEQDEHGHDEQDEHGHDEHDDHSHAGELDGHIWLDPSNSRRIVELVADTLSRHDPQRAAIYQRNKEATDKRIHALEDELRSRLAPVRDRPFLVFHDAYQYFEKAFGLEASGAITLGPERRPGAKRLASLRKAMVDHNIGCVFTEPQFRPDLALMVVEGTDTRLDQIDPLGANVEPGPDAWFETMNQLGTTFAECLSGS